MIYARSYKRLFREKKGSVAYVKFIVPVIVMLMIVFIITGCATIKQLKEFKNYHKKGEFESIFEEEIICKPTQDGCNQLHLIKGDTCWNLAKAAGKDPNISKEKELLYLECAVKELQMGIDMTDQWKLDKLGLNKPQTYENLFQAMRLLQDKQHGKDAEKTNKDLLKRTEQYLAVESGNIPALYFNYWAQFNKILPDLLKNGGKKNRRRCNRLNEIQTGLEEFIFKHYGDESQIWKRYESNIKLLSGNVITWKNILKDCD